MIVESGQPPIVVFDAPLAPPQRALWLLQTLHEECRAYNVTGALRLDGPLDVAALRASVRAVLRRHSSLRSVFHAVDGHPRRSIQDIAADPLRVRDLTSLSVAAQDDAVRDEIDRAVDRRFDLTRGPLFQLSVLLLGVRRSVLVLSAHHIVADGWSMDVLYREISAGYASVIAGLDIGDAPAAGTGPDKAAGAQPESALHAGTVEAARRYWRTQLDGVPAEISLPKTTDRPQIQSFRGAEHTFEVADDRLARLRTAARRGGVTAFTILLALYGVTLHSLCEQDSIVVGAVAANRDEPRVADVVGLYTSMLPIRLGFAADASFADVLRSTRGSVLAAQEYASYPFEAIIEEIVTARVPGAPPLVQVLFDVEYAHTEPLDLPGITVTAITVPTRFSKFDLSLIVRDAGDRLVHRLEYDTALFDASWADEFARRYVDVVDAVLDDPGEPLHRVLSTRAAATSAAGTPRVSSSEPVGLGPERDVSATHTEQGPVGSGIEALVLRLCAEVLGRQDVAIGANFFAAGGNSLLAVRLVYRLFEETGRTIPPGRIMRAGTLRDVAAILDEPVAPRSSPGEGA